MARYLLKPLTYLVVCKNPPTMNEQQLEYVTFHHCKIRPNIHIINKIFNVKIITDDTQYNEYELRHKMLQNEKTLQRIWIKAGCPVDCLIYETLGQYPDKKTVAKV